MSNLFGSLTPRRDFFLEIAKGTIKGHAFLRKFGHNSSVGTAFEDLWSTGGLYSWPTSASILKISSSDGNDTSAGTGARKIEIYGLDSNYLEINELVILNGQTEVLTVKSYLRIYRMLVRLAGDGATNAGILYAGTGTVTTGVPAVILAQIDVDAGQTLMALYTIPANKTAYLLHLQVSSDSQKATEVLLMVRPFGQIFHVKEHNHFYQNSLPDGKIIYIKIIEKSDVVLRAKVDTGTASLGGDFGLILVNN